MSFPKTPPPTEVRKTFTRAPLFLASIEPTARVHSNALSSTRVANGAQSCGVLVVLGIQMKKGRTVGVIMVVMGVIWY